MSLEIKRVNGKSVMTKLTEREKVYGYVKRKYGSKPEYVVLCERAPARRDFLPCRCSFVGIAQSFPLWITTCGKGISTPLSSNRIFRSLASIRWPANTFCSVTSTANFRFTPLSASASTPR